VSAKTKKCAYRQRKKSYIFRLKVSKFVREDSSSDEQKSKDYIPSKGTFPDIELDIVQTHQALKLAFPAKVLQPYRKIFYHLFLLNRAKYLIHRLENNLNIPPF
jgi:hypothetical protein